MQWMTLNQKCFLANTMSQMKWRPYLKTQTNILLSLKHLFASISLWRTLNTYQWTQFELWFSWNMRVSFKTKPKSIDLSPTTGYNIEYTSTECNNGKTSLYVKKKWIINFEKTSKHKPKQLESTFIEVVQNKERIIIGFLCRHPSMELSEFNSHYLSNFLDNLSEENKTAVFLGDFNADLLKYGKDCNVSDFLDTMCLNLLLLHIACSTCVTVNSQTLIDNIFPNNYDSSFTLGNLVTTLSDHHAQFQLMEF